MAAPGTARSASATVARPCARRRSPRSTVTVGATASAGVGSRVAVTTIGVTVTVSIRPCAASPDGTTTTSIVRQQRRTKASNNIVGSISGRGFSQGDHLGAAVERLDGDRPREHTLDGGAGEDVAGWAGCRRVTILEQEDP